MKKIKENTPLYTKNGQIIGNAIVQKQVTAVKGKKLKSENLYKIKTDYGTVLFMTLKEIEQCFTIGFGHLHPVEADLAKTNMHNHKHFHKIEESGNTRFPTDTQMNEFIESYISNSSIHEVKYYKESGNWSISYSYDVANYTFSSFGEMHDFLNSDQNSD